MSKKRTTNTVALKKIMIEKGVETITELSKISGVHRNILGQVLSGERQPSANVMNKLINALEISPEEAGKIFFNTDLLIA